MKRALGFAGALLALPLLLLAWCLLRPFDPDALTWLSDLPSAGDTAYAGVALQEGHVYASYYTSDPARDYPWLLGMVLDTRVRMARIPLASLHALGTEARNPEEEP